MAKTGNEKKWRTQFASKVRLSQGNQTLKFKALNNNWKIDWFKIKQI